MSPSNSSVKRRWGRRALPLSRATRLLMYDLADMQNLEPPFLDTPVARRQPWGLLPIGGIHRRRRSTPSLTHGRQLSPERSMNAIAPAFMAAVGRDKAPYT